MVHPSPQVQSFCRTTEPGARKLLNICNISLCAVEIGGKTELLLQGKCQSKSILLSKSPQYPQSSKAAKAAKAACRKLSGPLDYSELDEVGSAHEPHPAPQDTDPSRTVENELLRQNKAQKNINFVDTICNIHIHIIHVIHVIHLCFLA